ncbi:hypothetical protein [Thioclava sp. F28-4]|uniref:hypothetical protein n=1 Tax=Thioclava sp. F28-4 TaxID=1915315 RepID=UPI0009961063|nr:hypothetical protein [Thioclava sp. F28-4]OOY03203.1 hypothetical protein BMI87_18965 [Thioclava sp. F28-4]
MSQIASFVLGTVNTPYGANLSAHQLAQSISDNDAAKRNIGLVFAFFSEVPPELQNSFVSEMEISPQKVHEVARHFQSSCPFPLALAQ